MARFAYSGAQKLAGNGSGRLGEIRVAGLAGTVRFLHHKFRLRRRGLSWSQERVDFFKQTREVDRLGLVRVTTRFDRLFPVPLHRMSRQGDDGDLLRSRVRFEAAGGGPSIEARQTNVHQNQVRQPALRQGQSLLGILGREDFMTPGFEPAGQ